MSVAVRRAARTGIASARVASSSRRPRNCTGGPGEPREPRGGAHRAADLLVVAQLVEVDDLCPVDVGGGAVQLDPAGLDQVGAQWALACATPRRSRSRGRTADRPRIARRETDEAGVAETMGVEARQIRGLSGEQEGGVERARRSAVHLVEGVGQSRAARSRLPSRRRRRHACRRPRSQARSGDRRSCAPGVEPSSRRRRIAATTGWSRWPSPVATGASRGSLLKLRRLDRRMLGSRVVSRRSRPAI